MELNSIINNDQLSMKMKDIYKFIDKNEDKIDDIFNRTATDIKIIFSDVYVSSENIEIYSLDPDTIEIKKDECFNILHHHAKDVLDDNKYLLSYAFKINTLKDIIIISKKH